MKISEKQILHLMAIAQSHMANAIRFGEITSFEEVQDLLFQIAIQQSGRYK